LIKDINANQENIQSLLTTQSLKKHLMKFVKKMLMVSQSDAQLNRVAKQQFLQQ